MSLPTLVNPKGSHSASLFVLGRDILAALQNLDCALRLGQEDISEIKSALRVVFDALYYPESISEAYKSAIKAYPILQFLIYKFLTMAGTYSPVELIPPHLAKMQYCIRLRALHRIDLEVQKISIGDWKRYVFCLFRGFLQLFIPKALRWPFAKNTCRIMAAFRSQPSDIGFTSLVLLSKILPVQLWSGGARTPFSYLVKTSPFLHTNYSFVKSFCNWSSSF